MIKPFFSLFLALSSTALASEPATSLTIYSTAAPGAIATSLPRGEAPGYAMVRTDREVEIPENNTIVQFTDVAAFIDPTSVMFSSRTDPEGTHVISQSYLYDLASSEAMLRRYLGSDIEVEHLVGDKPEKSTGKLLSSTGDILLQEPNGRLKSIPQYSAIRFPSLPEGVMLKPTLLWEVAAEKTGTHIVRLSYQTRGMSWWTDYNAVFVEGKDANQGELDINAWVSILNQSGTSYTDSTLKLMAGDVHRITPSNKPKRPMQMMMAEAVRAPAFEEKPFSEYHLYTLNSLVSLPDNSTKQLELFPAVKHVPVAMTYEFNGQESDNVVARITFQNNSNYGLGMPLPAGRIRISKQDGADGNLEFIGEDLVPHTPKNEEVKVMLGQSFDITGKRVVLAERSNDEQKWSEEDVEITLDNRKDAPVTLVVKEQLGKSANWKVFNHNTDYEREGAQFIRFPVKLDKNGQQKVIYTVRYSW